MNGMQSHSCHRSVTPVEVVVEGLVVWKHLNLDTS